jgi:hypothetical protein
MTAWGTKAPRVGRKVKVTQVQPVQITPTEYTVHSIPYPIHTATITQNGRGGWWTVRYPTIGDNRGPYVYESLDVAMRNASDTISRKAGADLDRFTRAQAYAVAQQRCPYQPDRMVPRCCEQTPEVGTVWCAWHQGGKESK